MTLILENGDAPSGTNTNQVLAIGDIIAGQHSGVDTSDWYKVTLTAGTTYTFAMVGTGDDRLLDPYLTLYAPNGSTIRGEDDDGFSNTNALIIYTPTTSGTYYIDAGEFSSGGTDYRLSVTTGEKAVVDDEMIVGAINSAVVWSSTTVTYGFRTENATYENNDNVTGGSELTTFTVLSNAEEAAVESCLQQYSDVCGLEFEFRAPDINGDRASMLFGNYNDPNDGAGAFAYFPGSTATNSPDGDVWLNTDSVDTNSLPQGEYSYFALLHEIGHAMGLSHPGEYNAAPGLDILYENDARFAEDSNQYSIMSYFDGVDTGAQWNQMTSTLMMFDILALQTMYGVNTATRATDTVYGFGSSAGDAFDFDLNPDAIFCIWDGNGTDVIDASGFSDTQVIDLRDGKFSDVGGQTDNVSIAFNAEIENASGGSRKDTITGNSAANGIEGNNGHDILRGLAGADTIDGGLGNDRLSGGSGIDTFVFDAALGTANVDTLTDFVAGSEQITLQNSVFAGLAAGALANSAFVDGLTATRAKAQILYDEANGDLYFDADGTGGGLAVKFAQVDNNTAITTADFFVI